MTARLDFDALDAAGAACKGGNIDVAKMEALLAALLAEQLKSAYQQAGGHIDE